MNKILFGSLLIMLFVSCNKSPEEKANVLIEVDVKKTLYHPESYDPAETLLDSAFTPFDDPLFYEKTLQLLKIGMSIVEFEENMKQAQHSMSHYSGLPYQTAYDKLSYQEAKDDYDNNAQNKINAENKARMLADELKSRLNKEKQFIGFKARHRYRASNNAGQIVFGEMKYLFDKDFQQIIASYDMDGDEYKIVRMAYERMINNDIPLENNIQQERILDKSVLQYNP